MTMSLQMSSRIDTVRLTPGKRASRMRDFEKCAFAVAERRESHGGRGGFANMAADAPVVTYTTRISDERITLARSCGRGRPSRMYFAKQFRATTGIRPHDFVLRKRIERAQQLLAATSDALVDIALSVGFQTQAHFTHRCFKNIAGNTPSPILGPGRTTQGRLRCSCNDLKPATAVLLFLAAASRCVPERREARMRASLPQWSRESPWLAFNRCISREEWTTDRRLDCAAPTLSPEETMQTEVTARHSDLSDDR